MMRIVDVLYALPFTLLVILLITVFERSLFLLFIAIGAVEWLTMARIVRGQVMALRQQEFIEACRVLGYGRARILLRHLLDMRTVWTPVPEGGDVFEGRDRTTGALRWTAPRGKDRPVAERIGSPVMIAASTAPRFTLIVDPSYSTSTKDDGRGTMDEFALSQNYPNPFNPSTQIRFSLPSSHVTRLTVYDMLGREVAVLVNGSMPAGAHSVTFDASGLSSGTYIYRLEAGGQVLTRRMTLVK
jgi:hypothetical protein